MNPTHRFALLSFSLSIVMAAFVNTAAQIKPGRNPNQPIDQEYTDKIREYTTAPYFNSPLTDYLPASSKVPTPKAVLGDVAGAPGRLPYAEDVYKYMRMLEKATPRVKVYSIGTTEEGREMIAVAVASESLLSKLDENRARAQLAHKAGVSIRSVTNMTIWGTHSSTQYPDFYNAKIDGRPANEVTGDEKWLKEDFISTVQQRGAAVIKARGLSSAGSAANAVVDTVYSLINDTRREDWHSVAVCSDGSYDVEKGLISSFPVRVRAGKWEIVQGLPLNDFSRAKIDASVAELKEEKSLVSELL